MRLLTGSIFVPRVGEDRRAGGGEVGRRAGVAGQVSRSELAQLAGVRRATVTMWAKRHKNFPSSVWAGSQEYLDLASAVAWLDSRPIPESELWAGEEPGRTYGQRVRNVLSRRNDRVSPPEFLPPVGSSESVLRLLLEDAGLRLASTDVVYGVTGPSVTRLPECGVSP